MKILKNLPNLFTLLNLLAGCLGIIAVFQNDLNRATLMIIIGGIMDFFDGFFARMFKTESLFGKQLDSLADMVTFGLLPAFLMFFLFKENSTGYYPYISLTIVIASAARLARFNIDEKKQENFIGLPTPANAFLVVGIVHVYLAEWVSLKVVFENPNLLMIIILFQSFLLISNFQFISLKFKNIYWKNNEFRYVILLTGLLCITFLKLQGIFLAMLIYILLSITWHINQFLKSRP